MSKPSLISSRMMFLAALLSLAVVGGACSRPTARTIEPQPTNEVVNQEAPSTQIETEQSLETIEITPTRTSPPTTPPQLDATIDTTATLPAPVLLEDVLSLISKASLLSYLEDLTNIQPYSGWRNSATEGEVEALDYVEGIFTSFNHLAFLGLELERQSFGVFNATELWETRLHLTMDGQEIEVPVDSMRGNRDDNHLAVRFDSDGQLGDAERNPVTVEGPVVLAESLSEIDALTPGDVSGKVLFIYYNAISRVTLGDIPEEIKAAKKVLSLQPGGIVLVTRFSNRVGDAHGAFVGDVNAFTRIGIGADAPSVPVLYARLEDLAIAGIASWDDLKQVESAHLVWDADVISPGASGNLVATIPGVDRSKSVILSAHIDSPNSPGALDDGSGSVVLMEIGRVLNEARMKPEIDVVLVWYGSEEIGLYGSAHFVASHQELLDQTLAMLQVDCLTRPLDEIQDPQLNLVTWSYGRFGNDSLTWPDYLTDAAAQNGVEAVAENRYQFESDNTPFSGFDVPNANLIYISSQMERIGSVHYAGHLHSPYDTVELARDVADVLEQMAQVALTAALKTAREAPELRVTPKPDRRAVIIANHTEPEVMSPIGFTEFGMALAMEGFDVDMIPFGRPVTRDQLAGADLVIVLPLLDYATDQMENFPDENWSTDEIAVLEDFVAGGGFLVLTNSARRIKIHNRIYDPNEDWLAVNTLAERFGIEYVNGSFQEKIFWVKDIEHPLLEKVLNMELTPDNAIPMKISKGTVLAPRDASLASIVLVDHGVGEVLALADLGILGNVGSGTPENLNFWLNMARYARTR